MGFESCVLINHDFINTRKLEELGRNITDAILMPGENPRRFHEGLVIYTDHADATRLIVTGGHISEVLTVCAGGNNPADMNHQLDLVRHFAAKLGYRLTRMPGRPTKKRRNQRNEP